jgi:acyl dehydratase
MDATTHTATRLDRLPTLIGNTVGVSSWRQVTQEMVDRFAELTGDFQWVHVDQERAVNGPFGVTIAHGMLTVSVVPPMILEVLAVEDADLVINKGFDRVRLGNPVPVGSRIRGTVKVSSVRPRPRGYHEVGLAVAVEVAGQSGTALTADAILLYHGC